MKECTTHHHACDCREREFEKIREQRDELLAACEGALKCMESWSIYGPGRVALEEAVKKAKAEK
jgi:hypothetical protein